MQNIEVHLGEAVRDMAQFGNDPVIVATGAVPRILKNVPGHERMIEACEYLNGSQSRRRGGGDRRRPDGKRDCL